MWRRNCCIISFLPSLLSPILVTTCLNLKTTTFSFQPGHFKAKICLILYTERTPFTPFENPQRWMGQNTFPFLLLNDDNMIGEH